MPNVFDVAKYIAQKQDSLTPMKLQRLCYYAQAWSLVWDDEPLFDEDFQSWESGPVCVELFLKTYNISHIHADDISGNTDNLTSSQKNNVDSVLEYYGGHNAEWLSQLSKMEEPWIQVRNKGTDAKSRIQDIPKDSMKIYYSSLSKSKSPRKRRKRSK